ACDWRQRATQDCRAIEGAYDEARAIFDLSDLLRADRSYIYTSGSRAALRRAIAARDEATTLEQRDEVGAARIKKLVKHLAEQVINAHGRWLVAVVYQREREGALDSTTQKLRLAALNLAASGIIGELDPALRDFVLANEVHVPD